MEKAKSALIIQKVFRGFVVRNRLDRLNRAAQYIQGYLRMKWLSAYYKILKESTIKIQRFARTYLLKKMRVDEINRGFYSGPLDSLEALAIIENKILFEREKALEEALEDGYSTSLTVQSISQVGTLRKSITGFKSFIPGKTQRLILDQTYPITIAI